MAKIYLTTSIKHGTTTISGSKKLKDSFNDILCEMTPQNEEAFASIVSVELANDESTSVNVSVDGDTLTTTIQGSKEVLKNVLYNVANEFFSDTEPLPYFEEDSVEEDSAYDTEEHY
jgi:hypothetical protein